jgi:hypothetical protein
MVNDLIRYDLLVQDAMRDVLRKVLADVAVAGALPGDHHFTISFRTQAPGVRISKRLAEQWPQEMTIILQHQFSNLVVDERGFGVGLSFSSIPERLYIPFDAVTCFADPSVEFGLKFELINDEIGETTARERSGPTSIRDSMEAEANSVKPAALKPKLAKTEKAGGANASDAEKIVSIDAFRKKT